MSVRGCPALMDFNRKYESGIILFIIFLEIDDADLLLFTKFY